MRPAYGWSWCKCKPTRMPDQDSPEWKKARQECHEKCWDEVQKKPCQKEQEYRKCVRKCMQEHPKGPFSF